MLGGILILVGIAQILVAMMSFTTARSNIHEIFASILFVGAMVEFGIAGILFRMDAVVKAAKSIEEKGTGD